MSIEHEKNDINYGFFILEQYKIRRELGLLKSGNFNIVESICSKYFEPSFAFNEDKTKEIKEKYPYFELNEFERVLEELKRREELIQELLAKLERYETTLRDPEIHISSVQRKLSDNERKSECFIHEEINTDIQKPKLSNNNLCLWRSLLNSSLTRDITNRNECSDIQERGI